MNQAILLFLLDVNLFYIFNDWVKSAFKKVFDFKKLKIVSFKILIIFYNCEHMPFSNNKPYEPDMNFMENEYLRSFSMSGPGPLHVTVYHNLAV